MSFDGVPRPSQVNPYADPLSPYAAASAAQTDKAGKPLVKGPDKEEGVKAAHREEKQHRDTEDDEERGEAFSEEEAEQIRLMAKMRGLMNFSLEAGVNYEFQMNPETGLIDLIESESGALVMQLLPDELMQLSQKIQRFAGVLTDRAG